jgi:hypothetical protein
MDDTAAITVAFGQNLSYRVENKQLTSLQWNGWLGTHFGIAITTTEGLESFRSMMLKRIDMLSLHSSEGPRASRRVMIMR